MRTLNKALCLVLAVVMVVGMCAFSVSAEDNLAAFSDGKDVSSTYKEAIDLLVGIKVVEGMGDGTLNLTGKYTRAQAATIVARIKLGVTNANNLKCVTAPFTDVGVDHWAAGAIAYCAQAGILDGLGDGSFDPEGTLTGYAFGKMLLCAVGFGQNGEYVGTGWEINVAKDGVKRKVYDNNDLGAATNDVITRQQAMLMAFNTLTKVEVVKYSTLINDYVGVDASNSSIVTGNSVDKSFLLTDNFRNIKQAVGPVTWGGTNRGYVVDGSDYRYYAYSVDEDTLPFTVNQWVNGLFTGSDIYVGFDEVPVEATYEQTGRIGRVWYNDKAVNNNKIEAITSFYPIDTLLYESHDGTKFSTLTSRSSNGFKVDIESNSSKGVTCYLNGKGFIFDEDKLDGYSGRRGVSIAFYDYDKNNKADIIMITEKSVAKLTSTPTVSPDGKTVNINSDNPNLYGAMNIGTEVVGYEGLAKDDIVLFVKDSANVTHIQKADYVTGSVNRYSDANSSNSKIYIGGEVYQISGLVDADLLIAGIKGKNGSKCNFFKDDYGYIVDYLEVSTTNTSNYVVLLNLWYNTPSRNLNPNQKIDVYANVLKQDGTTQDVKLRTVKTKYIYTGGSFTARDYTNLFVKVKTNELGYDEGIFYSDEYPDTGEGVKFGEFTPALGYFYSMTGDASSGVTLTYITNQHKYDYDTYFGKTQGGIIYPATSADFVKNGKSTLGTANASDNAPTYYANNNTVYLYYTGSTYRAVTGVRNAPSSKADCYVTVIGREDLSTNMSYTEEYTAKSVFVSGGNLANTETEYFIPSIKYLAFIADDPDTDINEEGYVLNVMKDDKISEMTFSDTAYTKLLNVVDNYGPGWYDLELGGNKRAANFVDDVTKSTSSTILPYSIGMYSDDSGIVTVGKADVIEHEADKNSRGKLNNTYSYTSDVKVYTIDPNDGYALKIGGSELLSNDINDLVFPVANSDSNKNLIKKFVIVKVTNPSIDSVTANIDSTVKVKLLMDEFDMSSNYLFTMRVNGELVGLTVGQELIDKEWKIDKNNNRVLEIDTGITAKERTDYNVAVTFYDLATGVQWIASKTEASK
ncbi:MAG: S-layer homology domain-containing protein [Oscillospiraceae bacterium]|nr:S-layer homology domain-containing protein [Oscillospiraceae bacterium]